MDSTPAPDAAVSPDDGLYEAVLAATRDVGVQAERVSRRFATRSRIGSTDATALLHVIEHERAGHPLTAGALAEAVGVTTGAATGIIDRLCASGHVERVPDDTDRRRLHLRQAATSREAVDSFFGSLARRSRAMMERYPPQELEVVLRFLRDLDEVYRAHLDHNEQ